MTIAFFSNFLNHHQKPVADELYNLTGHQYTFIEVLPMPNRYKKNGYPTYTNIPYVLQAWQSEKNMQKAIDLASDVDVAVFCGPEVLSFEIIRARHTNKLTFELSERWLKKGWINLLSPRLIRNIYNYHTLFYKKPFYKLCASAYVPNDQYLLHTFYNRCYKWGYFTQVDPLNVTTISYDTKIIRMMWCSRFIKLKHPELPIVLAHLLKQKGEHISIDMYGSGPLLKRTKKMAAEYGVDDIITFCENMQNEQILSAMRDHEIFLLTSDKNEGWGAVANESMANGCVLVCSDSIGSAPYLVKDSFNGLLFKSPNTSYGFRKGGLTIDHESLYSLCHKIEWLLNNPTERKRIAERGYKTISQIWSPRNAAQNLMHLIDDLQQHKDCTINDGPCSKALPI